MCLNFILVFYSTEEDGWKLKSIYIDLILKKKCSFKPCPFGLIKRLEPCPFGLGLRKFALDPVVVFFFEKCFRNFIEKC